MSHGGAFVVTQLMAIAIGVYQSKNILNQWDSWHWDFWQWNLWGLDPIMLMVDLIMLILAILSLWGCSLEPPISANRNIETEEGSEKYNRFS